MAKTVKDSQLDSRTARGRLPVRGKPYYRGGTWSVRWYVGDGRYQLERLATADDKADADGLEVLSFSEAQAAARRRFAAATHSAAGLPAPKAGPYDVDAAMADYFAHLEGEGRSPKNVTDARRKAEAHVLPKFGNVRLDKLTAKAITDWLHGLAKAPPRLRGRAGERQKHRAVDMTDPEVRRARRATANKIWGGVFKSALNHAWRAGKVADDKAWRAVRPFKGATASRAAYLQAAEIGRLVNAADPDFRDMIRAGLHTGCRYSELCRLAPADFNGDAHTLAVRASKSGKPRHLHLTDQGAEFFADAVVRAGKRPHLFARADGKAWRTSWQIRLMAETCKRARIAPAIGFHGLRHCYASHALWAACRRWSWPRTLATVTSAWWYCTTAIYARPSPATPSRLERYDLKGHAIKR